MSVSVLLGKILSGIEIAKNREIIFTTREGEKYKLYHMQDCCESVWIGDIEGDLLDLIGSPLLQAEETVNPRQHNDYGTSTWTFYKFATIKGYVTIRWIGESNGYYSESVDFIKANKDGRFLAWYEEDDDE